MVSAISSEWGKAVCSQVRVGDELAVTYNDVSPMENHHAASAFKLMRHKDYSFMRRMPQDKWVSSPSGLGGDGHPLWMDACVTKPTDGWGALLRVAKHIPPAPLLLVLGHRTSKVCRVAHFQHSCVWALGRMSIHS